MIKVDALLAVSLFLCVFLLFVFVVWVFYNYRGGVQESDAKILKQCPYCSYLFSNDDEKSIQKCPRCESYLNVEEAVLKAAPPKGRGEPRSFPSQKEMRQNEREQKDAA